MGSIFESSRVNFWNTQRIENLLYAANPVQVAQPAFGGVFDAQENAEQSQFVEHADRVFVYAVWASLYRDRDLGYSLILELVA